MTGAASSRPRVLVTGGGGFVGGAVVRLLQESGYAVRSYSRGSYPRLAGQGVEVIQASLADKEPLTRACDGCVAVIHSAAKAGVWGPYSEYYETNVAGTANVIGAVRAASVPILVFTSSPSAVFDGSDCEGANESLKYPDKPLSHYAATKAQAEQLVLAANSAGLRTVALRPHLVWGPGDPHLLPRIVARAKAGRLRIVGEGHNRVDVTYIDNVAWAHLDALHALQADECRAAGQAYFITNGEPVVLWDFVNHLLSAVGLPPVVKRVPLGVARVAATILESVHSVLGLHGEPFLTRFVVEELAKSHWFDIAAARADLGYRPRVSLEEGLERVARHAGVSGA